MSNVRRVYVEKKGGYNVQQKALAHEIRNYLGIKDVEYVRILNRYDVENISMRHLKEHAMVFLLNHR